MIALFAALIALNLCVPPGIAPVMEDNRILYAYPITGGVVGVLVQHKDRQVLLVYKNLALVGVDPNVNDPAVPVWHRNPNGSCQWAKQGAGVVIRPDASRRDL
jgi:hypothetical protein